VSGRLRRAHRPAPAHPAGQAGGRARCRADARNHAVPEAGTADPRCLVGGVDRTAEGARMSWAALLTLAAGAYFFKLLGLVIIRGRPVPERVRGALALIPAALLSSLIVANTVTVGQHLVIDARLPGVLAAAVAAWRKLPFPAVIVIGAAVTALVRAF